MPAPKGRPRKPVAVNTKDAELMAVAVHYGWNTGLVRKYLKQWQVEDDLFFAFPNDAGGHSLFRRDMEKQRDYRQQLGPEGIRTILPGPKPEIVKGFIYPTECDFLTYCQLNGYPKTDELHIITNGLTEKAALQAKQEPRLDRVIYFMNGDYSEYDFMEIYGAVFGPEEAMENLANAYIRDQETVRRANRGKVREMDQTQASSMTMRLRPGA